MIPSSPLVRVAMSTVGVAAAASGGVFVDGFNAPSVSRGVMSSTLGPASLADALSPAVACALPDAAVANLGVGGAAVCEERGNRRGCQRKSLPFFSTMPAPVGKGQRANSRPSDQKVGGTATGWQGDGMTEYQGYRVIG